MDLGTRHAGFGADPTGVRGWNVVAAAGVLCLLAACGARSSPSLSLAPAVEQALVAQGGSIGVVHSGSTRGMFPIRLTGSADRAGLHRRRRRVPVHVGTERSGRLVGRKLRFRRHRDDRRRQLLRDRRSFL